MNNEINGETSTEISNETNNNKTIKRLVIVIILFVLCLGGYLAYIFIFKDNTVQNKNDEYLVKFEEYMNNHYLDIESFKLIYSNETLEITDDNIEHVKEVSITARIDIPKSGNDNGNDKYKNGYALLSFYINKDGELEVKFISIYDEYSVSYLNELSEKKFIVKLKNEKFKHVMKDEKYIYLLTEKGNLYIFYLNDISNTSEFESDLERIKNKDFEDSIINNNIKEMLIYYEDAIERENKQIYLLLGDGSKINALTRKSIEEAEKYAYFYRYGNEGLVITREGKLRYCNSWQGKQYCTEDKLSEIITDENNNPIIVSAIFVKSDFGAEIYDLFIIDSNGYIYSERFDNLNLHAIKKLKRYNNKVVRGFTYISKVGDTYRLEDLIVDYVGDTHELFGENSRLSIFIKSRKKPDLCGEDGCSDETEYYEEEEKKGMSYYEEETKKGYSYYKDDITYEISKYDYSLTSKDKYFKSTKEILEEGLYTLYEGEKYEELSYEENEDRYIETIELLNGKAVITKKNKTIETEFDNIKSMHFMGICGDDYHGEFALLTKDGDIYISNSICDYSGENGAQLDEHAFENMTKIESKNKYKDIGMVLKNYKYYYEEYAGDTVPYQFVGITTDDKMDLIVELVNGEPWEDITTD